MKTAALAITRVLLLTLFSASFTAWGMRTFARQHMDRISPTQVASDDVIVVNFHGTTRCNGWMEIGQAAQCMAESDFADPRKEAACTGAS